MNEKIKELAEQAGQMTVLVRNGVPILYYYVKGHGWMAIEQLMEKFAELIVRECAEVCYHHSEAAGGVDTAFGYGYKDCGNDIKKHFGVES